MEYKIFKLPATAVFGGALVARTLMIRARTLMIGARALMVRTGALMIRRALIMRTAFMVTGALSLLAATLVRVVVPPVSVGLSFSVKFDGITIAVFFVLLSCLPFEVGPILAGFFVLCKCYNKIYEIQVLSSMSYNTTI